VQRFGVTPQELAEIYTVAEYRLQKSNAAILLTKRLHEGSERRIFIGGSGSLAPRRDIMACALGRRRSRQIFGL